MNTDYRPQTTDHRLKAKKTEAFYLRLAVVSLLSLVFCLQSFAAQAANYDIKEMTPDVREALAGRQTRYSELQAAKRSGSISENNEGLVSGNSDLARAENHDRLVIYQTIADQNNLGSAGLSQIKRAFAETIRERDGR